MVSSSTPQYMMSFCRTRAQPLSVVWKLWVRYMSRMAGKLSGFCSQSWNISPTISQRVVVQHSPLQCPGSVKITSWPENKICQKSNCDKNYHIFLSIVFPGKSWPCQRNTPECSLVRTSVYTLKSFSTIGIRHFWDIGQDIDYRILTSSKRPNEWLESITSSHCSRILSMVSALMSLPSLEAG